MDSPYTVEIVNPVPVKALTWQFFVLKPGLGVCFRPGERFSAPMDRVDEWVSKGWVEKVK